MDNKIITSKKLVASFIIFGLSFVVSKAQYCTPSIISTDGNYYANAAGSVSFTIGEPIIETYSDATNVLTQGFQQTDYSFVGVDNIAPENVTIKVYPNPFQSEFTINNSGEKQSYAEITDLLGKVIYKTELTKGNNQINPGNLSDAVYLLKVYDNTGAEIQTFKMIKNQ
jgi:hypothetical protein